MGWMRGHVRAVFLLVLISLALLTLGCQYSITEGKKDIGDTCRNHIDCATGLVCQDRTCADPNAWGGDEEAGELEDEGEADTP